MNRTQEMTETLWDLIVVGGGMTGVAAAVSAKRQGLKNVLIIEKAGFLGGAAATELINPYMPYYTKVDGQTFYLSRGFFLEMRRMILDLAGCDETDLLHEEYVKIAFDALVRKEGIQPLFHGLLCGVEKENDHISAIRVAFKCGILEFRSRFFIDCTGDADLAAMAGCPYHLGRPDGLTQPMTLCFRIGNIDIPTFNSNRKLMQDTYTRLKDEGKIHCPRENVLVFRTLVDGMLHFNTTRIVKRNPTDPFDVTEAEIEARSQMLEIFHFLRNYVPGCEKAQLLYSAGEIGARESRMIDGAYTLTQEDCKACTKFPDAIAACNYDIDIHNPEGSGTSHYYFEPGTWYTIPYRCLVPLRAENLLVAGRCVSCTHEAQASLRCMPTVTTMGEAAGIAAYLAVSGETDNQHISVSDLQKKLTECGAFTGLI